MKTKLFLISIISAFFAFSCGHGSGSKGSGADSTVKEISDAIKESETYYLEYRMTMDMNGLKNVSVVKEWIDMNNDMTASENLTETEVMGMKTREHTLTIDKGGWSYVINLSEKSGVKMKSGELKEDLKNIFMPEMV